MQRYRVNLPLLIALSVGSVVVLGGSYGLYRFQKSRNASRLLEREKVARDAGDLRESSKLLIQYLGLRINDEDTMVQLSDTLLLIAQSPEAEPIDMKRAMQQCETTLRNFPEQVELRRRVVDFYMESRVLKQALDHISQLLNRTPKDEELLAMQSECLFASASPKAISHAYRLIGYNEQNGEFDAEAATSPHEPVVYLRLAQKLRSDQYDDVLADQVIERMIEANPESGQAYLLRGQYREIYDPDAKELAAGDLRKARELDPNDASIVASNARLAARDEDFESAAEMLSAALKEHPGNPMLYLTLSQVRVGADDLEGALAACAEGLAAVPVNRLSQLLIQKVQLELRAERLDDARQTIKQMRTTRAVREVYPDYFEARIWMGKNKWFEAAQVFDKYEPVLSAQNPTMGLELNCMLGLCRERLGQDELALAAFERGLNINRAYKPAELGRQRMLSKMGQTTRDGDGVSIYTALALELAKPENQQDWAAFDDLAQLYVERMQLGKGMLEVLRGEVFMRRKMYPEARKSLLKAYELEPDNLGVRRAAVKLFAADPDHGPVKALKLLDKVVADFGDMPILRLERANLLTAIYPDDLTEQLFALVDGTESWTAPQRVQLLRGLGETFGRLKDQESRTECLDRIAELMPNDLQTLLQTFELARDSGDDAKMLDAQDKILAVVGNDEDPTWLYTEARRLVAAWTRAGRQGEQLDRAASLVERALSQRGEWNQLHNVQAEIALAKGDIRGALESFDRAAQLGRQDPRGMFQYIKLLMARGRFADALTQLEKLGRDGRIRLLGQDYAECLVRVGRAAEAVVVVDEYVERAPNNASVQLWRGRFLSRAAKAPGLVTSKRESDREKRAKELVAAAGEAFTKAVELDPRSPEGWLALVGYHAAYRDFVKADDTIRDAQLMLEEDRSQLLFARCYEMVGRGIDAEALYQQALEGASEADRPGVARLIAQFYLGPAYRRNDSIKKATPLLNEVLRAVDEGTLAATDASARWARSTTARLFAKRGGYQDLRNAERLLSSNAEGGILPVEDRLLMAEILAPRPEAVSRLKAARLLEEISQNQRLSQKSELDLGKLYYAVGEWRNCREQMLGVIARYPKDINARTAYLEMLFRRGGPNDIDEAVRQVKRLEEVAPKQLATREMLARAAYEKGRKQEASRIVVSLLPRDTSKITPEQLPLVRRVAGRLLSFEDYERARKVYELAAQVGGAGDRFALALFIGQHVDAQQGLSDIESLRSDGSVAEVVARGLLVLRAVDQAEEVVPEEMFQQVQGWLDRGLREDPDQIALRLQQGELYDLKREYDSAEQVYRELLDRGEVKGAGRAVVLNNLAYLLALAQKDKAALSDAAKYTDEAVSILGPGSDILDTRAVIAIADGRFNDAIEDLKLAVLDKPTASKYFHLAAAYVGSGKPQLASNAWSEAIDRGLTRDSVSRLEREQFDQLKQQIESGAITSVIR